MATTIKPSRSAIAKLAEERPHLLNPLVAFFVMGWQRVFLQVPMTGVDQTGKNRLLPDYVHTWGIDRVVHYLIQAPAERIRDNDFLTHWLAGVSRVRTRKKSQD